MKYTLRSDSVTGMNITNNGIRETGYEVVIVSPKQKESVVAVANNIITANQIMQNEKHQLRQMMKINPKMKDRTLQIVKKQKFGVMKEVNNTTVVTWHEKHSIVTKTASTANYIRKKVKAKKNP